MGQKQLKKRSAYDRPIFPNLENKWIHEIDCSKRENEEKKALIENLKEETEKRARIHKAAIKNIQIKDQIIAKYRGKSERCIHALEVMPKAWFSTDEMNKVT